ncbi:MAG: hypothetical protein KAH32_00095 [Chlamydiia bacterium]|nr:hypothetical protein [Chlamydiia bacterium]
MRNKITNTDTSDQKDKARKILKAFLFIEAFDIYATRLDRVLTQKDKHVVSIGKRSYNIKFETRLERLYDADWENKTYGDYSVLEQTSDGLFEILKGLDDITGMLFICKELMNMNGMGITYTSSDRNNARGVYLRFKSRGKAIDVEESRDKITELFTETYQTLAIS